MIYYIWLKSQSVDFVYLPAVSFSYLNEAGCKSVYEPDFLINGQLYEIKGDHFFNDAGQLINPYAKGKPLCLAKQQCMIDHGVTVLKKVDLLDAFSYIESMKIDISQYRIKRVNNEIDTHK